ncbi:MAG: hypothetical protein M3Y06_04130 [Actinomycetota bacterium]|nr:hypothetical protein [Actinomycetota bacterium]
MSDGLRYTHIDPARNTRTRINDAVAVRDWRAPAERRVLTIGADAALGTAGPAVVVVVIEPVIFFAAKS